MSALKDKTEFLKVLLCSIYLSYVVLVEVNEENPASHRHVVGKNTHI